MQDLNGTEVVVGDLLIEFGRGISWGWEDNKKTYWLKLWEMPPDYEGQGFYYSTDGSKHTFWWAHIEHSAKINKEVMPPDFLYSFYHGMTDLQSEKNKGTLQKILDASDWKDRIVTPEDVGEYQKLLNLVIKTRQDVADNIELLRNDQRGTGASDDGKLLPL